MKSIIRSLMFRIWYWYINKVDKEADILFMNYGYEDPNMEVSLDEQDEADRYSIQLYHRLASTVDLKSKEIVEIGCGRGGGLAYITKTFSPSGALGIDLDSRAANFGNKHYHLEGLKFMQGDAQNLPLDDNSYDVVINVESSHRYPDFKSFLSEVSRILKPDGYFLFTDFRYHYEMDDFKEAIGSLGLHLLEEININQNVADALKLDSVRREDLVQKLAPKILHKTALNFAGALGSETYNQILSGEYVYFMYIFQKRLIKD